MENKFIQLTGKRESDGILLPVSRVQRWDMSDGRTMVVLFENRHRLEGFYVKESITEIAAMLRSSITNVVSLHLVDEPRAWTTLQAGEICASIYSKSYSKTAQWIISP